MESCKKAVIDLCCGLGGLSLAAQNIGLQPIIGVDICKNALKTYQHNFAPIQSICNNIKKKKTIQTIIDTAKVLKKSQSELIIVSGPPCQGFSVAGKRIIDDPRNKIFVAVAKAISSIKPKAAIVENVSAVLFEKYSSYVSRFTKILKKSDYYVCPVLVNAESFGTPQKRSRALFFITKKPVAKQCIEKLLENEYKDPKTVSEVFAGLPVAPVRPDNYTDDLSANGIYNHFAMQHSAKVKKKIATIAPGTGPLSYRKLHPDKSAGALICGHRAPPAHFSESRSITAREAARLQELPDNFIIYGKHGSQIQQVANAVPTALGQAALKVLLKIME
ncbi:MAG: DNA cytosine methyltransferase [Sedimentisphaerales bacterium]|jgi:DNA (cytosine-5)-methyltransferase 1